jgi:predicted  nucleic acid-binding Zn-ribbon protein
MVSASKCYWRFHNGHGGEWKTSCGAWYDANDFGCETIRTCPNCGKETLRIRRLENETDSNLER